MPFANMMNDTVDLLKADGDKKIGLKASVQKNKIFMEAKDVLIETHDLIIRRMSNGMEETYRVIDPGFHEDFHGIKAHYQMDVEKLGLPEAKNAVQHITYNITGNNARVNQSSVDNSVYTVQIDERATQYIESLRTEIAKSSLSTLEKSEANEIVDEVENTFRAGKPKKSIISALLNALPHIATATSIISAIAGLAGVGP